MTERHCDYEREKTGKQCDFERKVNEIHCDKVHLPLRRVWGLGGEAVGSVERQAPQLWRLIEAKRAISMKLAFVNYDITSLFRCTKHCCKVSS